MKKLTEQLDGIIDNSIDESKQTQTVKRYSKVQGITGGAITQSIAKIQDAVVETSKLSRLDLQDNNHRNKGKIEKMKTYMEGASTSLARARTVLGTMKILSEDYGDIDEGKKTNPKLLARNIKSAINDFNEHKADIDRAVKMMKRGDIEDAVAGIIVTASSLLSAAQATLRVTDMHPEVQKQLNSVINGVVKMADKVNLE